MQEVKIPKVFLDKSPKIVEYQLKRLSNAELLLVERATDSPKYAPVFTAILSRVGIPSGQRQAAAEALAKIKSTSVPEELLAALGSFASDDRETARAARDLVSILLAQPVDRLLPIESKLTSSLTASSAWARRAASACLLVAGKRDPVLVAAGTDPNSAVDFLTAIPWIDAPAVRDSLRSEVLKRLKTDQPLELRLQAIRTLATISAAADENFRLLAQLVGDAALGSEAVKALLQIQAHAPTVIDANSAGLNGLARQLIDQAESTPIAERSSDGFVDRAQLLEILSPGLPAEVSKSYLQRMRAVAIRVVRIRTVEEEMRYDLKYFAVEAGKPVEIVLRNEDLMPHNLVVTVPGALKEVAMEAAKMPPDLAPQGKQYVPQSDQVLFATSMVPAGKQERLAFSAPDKPGEYPFVCTFPNHWMRMYGVMVVVGDLESWQKKPIVPADPIGNNRSFVRKWKVSELTGQLETGLRGRSPEIGARLFKEATCGQCHKVHKEGGIVGPDLTDLSIRWKGDVSGILQEILDPSHKIDSKYAVQSILTTSGKVYSGIIVAEDKDSLSLLTSPEQLQPTKIARDDVDEIIKSSKSIMPIGLLDQYTQDEIFEILSYLMNNHR